MFQINDYVVLGSTGVCQVVDICKSRSEDGLDRTYYVLNPVHAQGLVINMPTDNQAIVMRRIMTRDELDELLSLIPGIESEWIRHGNLRRSMFTEVLQSGDQKKLIWMIKTLYIRRANLEKNGKKLSSLDAEALKSAEKMLFYELALVLGIDPEEVPPFIEKQIGL
ncbi:MAG: CarD family transcriptional regulator [Clostridia bacterium]|nr:CarD family transcriptional regulator [Clostridia bacterium]